MSVASCLLLYSFAVAVLGPRLLVRLTRAGVAPRLGVGAWLAAIGSVVLSWVTAAAFLGAELVEHWNQPGRILSTCFAALRSVALGRYGVFIQFGLLALTTFAALALVVLAGNLARSLARARASTYQHARMARLAGREVPGLDAVVLDAPERAAYCAAGRPHTIVVTSAALEVLDDRQLGAVLSHERAHLAGRHHLLLALTAALATMLPRLALFTTGAFEVARLLEMCADDAAARTHGARTVLGALLTLCGGAPIPTGALGATGVGVLARAERLVAPPRAALRWRVRLLLSALTILLVTGPVLTGVLADSGMSSAAPLPCDRTFLQPVSPLISGASAGRAGAAQDVGVGRDEPQRRVAEAVELFDVEAGRADRRGGVPVGVTAAAHAGPQWRDGVLRKAEQRVGGAHVLEEAQLATGAQDPADLRQRPCGIGHRAQHERGHRGVEGRVLGG